MVRCDDVFFGYGRRRVFSSLDVSISPGITGLLGPNGAGKSTLLSLIGTRRAVASGRVAVLGEDVTTFAGRAAIRPLIGFLDQRYPLVGSMRVIDTVAYAAWAQGLSRKNSYPAAEDSLCLMDIEDLSRRRVRSLSGGQRQRVGLAASIAHRPRLLLLDEPTAGLDPEVRMALRKTLKTMSAECSIMLSTHLVDDVLAVCDRIVVLDRGRILFAGDPRAVEALAEQAEPDTPGSDLEKGYGVLLVRGRANAAA